MVKFVTISFVHNFVANLREWESKIESGDLVKYCKFVRNAMLPASDSLLEATAWENGFVPESKGLLTAELERRIQASLPQLACMVSRPRQSIEAGEGILRT